MSRFFGPLCLIRWRRAKIENLTHYEACHRYSDENLLALLVKNPKKFWRWQMEALGSPRV
jgi:hypothetical protein